MPLRITHVWNFLVAVQGIFFLAGVIKDDFLSSSIPVLLDLGKRPWSVWRIGIELFFTACFFSMAWGMVVTRPWTESLSYIVFLAGVFAISTHESLQPLCLREDGMRVLTKQLWHHSSRFLPWSALQQPEWVDATTFTVNAGWHQITCRIPEEHVSTVKAIMQERVGATRLTEINGNSDALERRESKP